MDKLKEYFEKDCGEMDKNRAPFDFYSMGYNRAKIEELEAKIEQLQRQIQIQKERMMNERNC